MPEKSRQQKRARSRKPLNPRRKSGFWFAAFMTFVVIAGVLAVFLSKANPPPLTRGASIGEHWHASYKIYICGARMTNFPTVEGEIHSHGDGFMHIHPQTQAYAGDNANVATFLRLYETNLDVDSKGRRRLTFPDGTVYTDGYRCPNDHKKYDMVVTNKGKTVKGDPGAFLPHDGDAIVISFGKISDKKKFENPYSKLKGMPDPGLGGATPAPG